MWESMEKSESRIVRERCLRGEEREQNRGKSLENSLVTDACKPYLMWSGLYTKHKNKAKQQKKTEKKSIIFLISEWFPSVPFPALCFFSFLQFLVVLNYIILCAYNGVCYWKGSEPKKDTFLFRVKIVVEFSGLIVGDI